MGPVGAAEVLGEGANRPAAASVGFLIGLGSEGFVLPTVAALLVGLLVWGLIFWCVVRYRKRGEELPPQTRFNLPIEMIYTVAPFLIISVLFYYTAVVQTDVTKLEDNPDVDEAGVRNLVNAFVMDESGTDIAVVTDPAGVFGTSIDRLPHDEFVKVSGRFANVEIDRLFDAHASLAARAGLAPPGAGREHESGFWVRLVDGATAFR